MVLKKPYAFLIKHFRIIHLLLAIPIIYLIINTRDIVSFLTTYINAGYSTNVVNVPGTYINLFMYLAALVVILVVLLIYFLMKQKKKSTRLYQGVLINYVIYFIVLGLAYSFLSSLETGGLEAKTVRMIRDISYVIYFPQYIVAVMILLRGFGFNIKKFNFGDDLKKELEIDDTDSEEFEFKVDVDSDKYKRNARRFLRELRYYFKENTFMISIVAVILVAVVGTFYYLNFGVYNKTYSEKQTMSHNALTISVTESYVTNMDYAGNIFSDDKYYVVVVFNITNNTTLAKTIESEKFYLEYNGTKITPILDRGDYFIDSGIPYKLDVTFKAGTSADYVMVYEIDSSLVNANFTVKILESIEYQKELGSITPNYKNISLSPEIYTSLEETDVRLSKIVILDETNLNLSEIKIDYFNIYDTYEYTYEYCYTGGTCKELTNKIVATIGGTGGSKVLLVIDAEYSVDEGSYYYKNMKSSSKFIGDFIKVRYYTYTSYKTVSVTDVTPSDITDKIILEVPADVRDSVDLDILFTTRNKRYVFTLK